MNTKRWHQPAQDYAPTVAISNKLQEALEQIEQRFLDGGTVLVSVLDVFTGLLSSLDNISNALREDEAAEATKELLHTGELIAALPAQQKERRDRFSHISEYGQLLAGEVLDMEDTLRYLRTFAMTAKITGAGIADFAGFAEEIVERIQFASQEVKGFSVNIQALQELIGKAHSGGEALVVHERDIPAIVRDLQENAKAIQTQRSTLADIACQVKDLAMKVQGRLSSTLSSLQIGDVTRQRIEHCQAAFEIVNDHLAREYANALSDEDRDRVTLLAIRLVRDQLLAIFVDFKAQCATIVQNIGAFSNDVAALMRLQQSMLPTGDGSSKTSALGRVRESLESARHVVAGIEHSAGEATRLSGAAGAMVKTLVESVETIQIVRTDIQYMALNTNLRCSKLGEESRAINVVTNELRAFSARLDDVTDRALEDLRLLNDQAVALHQTQPEDQNGNGPDLVAHIEVALAHVVHAGETLEEKVNDLGNRGQDVAIKVAAAAAGLDFHQDLTAILGDCASLAGAALPYEPTYEDLDEVLETVSAEIFATYTMKSERDVHAVIFGIPDRDAAKAETRAEPQQNVADEDLFDDALF